MAEPFIFINTYGIKPGKADRYEELFGDLVKLVETKEPQMLYFATHYNEDRTEATTVQVHASAENMAFHMELAADHIRQAMNECLDATAMHIKIYGTPTEALLDQMRELAGTGVPVSICTSNTGFNRFSQSIHPRE